MAPLAVAANAVSVAPDGTAYPLPDAATVAADFAALVAAAAAAHQAKRQVVVVQGLGFVGAAVAAVIAGATDPAGHPRYLVIGIDRATPHSYWKIAKLRAGIVPMHSPDPELPRLIAQAVQQVGNLLVTVDERAYGLADVVVVDVPLDVCDHAITDPKAIQIDLASFQAAVAAIGRQMQPATLVLVETTVPPGTCQAVVLPTLQAERAKRGIDTPVLLAHAYERVMPGPHYVDSIRSFWRAFAGIDPASAAAVRSFLGSFTDIRHYPLHELAAPVDTEVAKLLENSYRAANIALIHEWTLLAEQLGVDLFAIIAAIRVRQGTHDNIRTPGFGVGGYCLTKDALLAQWGVDNFFGGNVTLEMTLQALAVNRAMPLHTFGLLADLATDGLAGRTVLVCGVAYLPEVADTRHTPTALLVAQLQQAGAQVRLHDPYVTTWDAQPDLPIAHDLGSALAAADAIVLAVPHHCYQALTSAWLIAHGGTALLLVDAQNIVGDEHAAALHRAGWRLAGVGKGHWRKRGYQWLTADGS